DYIDYYKNVYIPKEMILEKVDCIDTIS
ncbi:MAG: hypothetical protein K0Q65_1848, partial [Clostridia bacterium]|nr:hypothetical protein [Clostridia bacterium]